MARFRLFFFPLASKKNIFGSSDEAGRIKVYGPGRFFFKICREKTFGSVSRSYKTRAATMPVDAQTTPKLVLSSQLKSEEKVHLECAFIHAVGVFVNCRKVCTEQREGLLARFLTLDAQYSLHTFSRGHRCGKRVARVCWNDPAPRKGPASARTRLKG